jgi:hypothetical protein
MTASIILSDFEKAAYTTQMSRPRAPLIYHKDEQLETALTPADQRKQLNEKTWKVFIDSHVKVMGHKKFQWICERYHFDAEDRMRTGKPLLAEHVELFSIGAAQQFTRDVKRLAPGKKIKELTRYELQHKLQEAQPFAHILGRYLNPMHIGGAPADFRAWFVHDPLLMDKEKQVLFSDVQHLSFPAYLERLCKCVSNRELQEKQIIPAPGADGELDYYRVYRKICSYGLVSYFLKPAAFDSTLTPLVIFRQTQMAPSHEDMVQSVFNDLETTIGKSGYTAAQPQLDRLMNDPSFVPPGTKIMVAGYSLGGAHAQHLCIGHHAKIAEAHFYSDPSIDAESVERFAKEINESNRQLDPMKISIYRVDGDYVHYTGQKHVGWNLDPAKAKVELIEINHENRQIAALTLHSFKLYDNVQLDYRINRKNDPAQLNNHLDNSKRGPEVLWYERMRLIWGKIVYGYLFVMYAIVKAVQKLFGFHFLRSSQDSR